MAILDQPTTPDTSFPPPTVNGPKSPHILPAIPGGPEVEPAPIATSPNGPSTTSPVPQQTIPTSSNGTPTVPPTTSQPSGFSSISNDAQQPVSAHPITASHADTHDDNFSSDDNTRNDSNTSSVHVTPKTKQTRFMSRKMVRTASPGHAGIETSALSCELALLNALSSDIEGSVERLDRERWKTRIAQINQVVRMVQWEAQGLCGLA